MQLPHYFCLSQESGERHGQEGCCTADTRYAPSIPSCPPLPVWPEDATGSQAWL